MIDTHCHLTDERLASQLDAVLARAAAAGVERFVTISTDPDDAAACIQLCRGRTNVRCSVGVHPNHVREVEPGAVPTLRALQADPAVVAIGECGLDYHYDVPRDRQRQFFVPQLQLAADVGKPVVIHSRESVDDCLAVLRDFPSVRAVFHCFTGTATEAERILAAGYLLGFTGPITYKKNDALRAVVAACPLDRLLVETDAPYLSPEPVRKHKTCEPAFVAHTLAVVAQVKGMSVDEVDRATTRNAEAFFGLV
ncbi:MAG TPA: TatD family hydrolase [Tepidisphaeraceae bacterium]|nr:TatD family hydrolase [Tepidisphaeraceae bacterium]